MWLIVTAVYLLFAATMIAAELGVNRAQYPRAADRVRVALGAVLWPIVLAAVALRMAARVAGRGVARAIARLIASDPHATAILRGDTDT